MRKTALPGWDVRDWSRVTGRVSELNLCFVMTYLSFIKYLPDSLVNKRGSRDKQVSGQTIVGK